MAAAQSSTEGAKTYKASLMRSYNDFMVVSCELQM